MSLIIGSSKNKILLKGRGETTKIRMGKNSNLILLKNGNTSVTVLPGIGGRVVSLTINNSKNIFKSDSALWDYKFNKPIKELILNNIIPFNGHIVWVGPQSEWWLHQNINKELREKKSEWPPDPYLIYGNFNVVQHDDNYIKMKGPESIYTGVALTKEIFIKKDGRVIFSVDAKNINEKPIAWDLWLNTRMDGFDKVYVPVSNEGSVRVEHRNQSNSEPMPYKIENGYFYFETIPSSSNKLKRDGKAFIFPSRNKIFAFTKDEMLVIKFEKYDENLVHREQGMIEIYNSVTGNNDALMELEYHTPYQTIKPNKKISAKEEWEIVKYKKENNTKEHINFINEYLGLN